jgi:hypothetical protein
MDKRPGFIDLSISFVFVFTRLLFLHNLQMGPMSWSFFNTLQQKGLPWTNVLASLTIP